MENAPVYEDTVARLLRRCHESFGDTFKYYDGDPISIPSNCLPCIIVEKIQGDFTLVDAPTGFDRFSEQIAVSMCFNKADDAGASDDVDLTERKLRRFIEARDPITKTYLDDTLMSVVRRHVTLDDSTFNSDVSVRYDINPRPDMMATSEGTVTITCAGIVPVPNRD